MRLRLLVAVLVAFLVGAAPGTTTASALGFSYDVPAIARVGVQSFADAEANATRLSDVREGSASPSAQAQGTSTTPNPARNATNTADDIAGLADDYIDITAKGSRVRNVQTSVSRSSFEQNLIEAGYQPTVVSPGKNVVSYELNGTRYVVRDAATSTGGPTADFYPVGSSSFTLKIRLGG